MAAFLRLTALTVAAALPFTTAHVAPAFHAGSQKPGPASPAFRFTTDAFWLNLHQFLYVLGRAQLQGSQALETAFHEAMHQWDQDMLTRLHAAAREKGVEVDGWLSHAIIFYTAGEATRRAVPGHEPYARKNGVWARGREPLRQSVEAAWQPWLDGKVPMDAAIRDLVIKAAPPAR